jgi:hypothetical protein
MIINFGLVEVVFNKEVDVLIVENKKCIPKEKSVYMNLLKVYILELLKLMIEPQL